jgi:hypothetical protein
VVGGSVEVVSVELALVVEGAVDDPVVEDSVPVSVAEPVVEGDVESVEDAGELGVSDGDDAGVGVGAADNLARVARAVVVLAASLVDGTAGDVVVSSAEAEVASIAIDGREGESCEAGVLDGEGAAELFWLTPMAAAVMAQHNTTADAPVTTTRVRRGRPALLSTPGNAAATSACACASTSALIRSGRWRPTERAGACSSSGEPLFDRRTGASLLDHSVRCPAQRTWIGCYRSYRRLCRTARDENGVRYGEMI